MYDMPRIAVITCVTYNTCKVIQRTGHNDQNKKEDESNEKH